MVVAAVHPGGSLAPSGLIVAATRLLLQVENRLSIQRQLCHLAAQMRLQRLQHLYISARSTAHRSSCNHVDADRGARHAPSSGAAGELLLVLLD